MPNSNLRGRRLHFAEFTPRNAVIIRPGLPDDTQNSQSDHLPVATRAQIRGYLVIRVHGAVNRTSVSASLAGDVAELAGI